MSAKKIKIFNSNITEHAALENAVNVWLSENKVYIDDIQMNTGTQNITVMIVYHPFDNQYPRCYDEESGFIYD